MHRREGGFERQPLYCRKCRVICFSIIKSLLINIKIYKYLHWEIFILINHSFILTGRRRERDRQGERERETETEREKREKDEKMIGIEREREWKGEDGEKEKITPLILRKISRTAK